MVKGRAVGAPRASVWLTDAAARTRTRRSEQPSGLDRERITAATVRLLDREGLARFSMRRLAGELKVTAMSVYWYVDTKEDLLELALDAVVGELTVGPEGLEGDWRQRLRELARAYRAMMVRHPWVAPLMGSYLNIGPCSQAFSRRMRAVLHDSGLGAREQLGALSAVFRFVYGFGAIEGNVIRRCRAAGHTQDEYYREAMGSMARRPEFVESFGDTEELFGPEGMGGGVAEMRERDFAFALDLLVTGIEAMARETAAT
ncbi:TetR/AcrR family transcriptional regulator [Streptomyces sp. NRRL F-5630]|uniref:TetR/AcrR family transcriptional regulator n=1 Tax=Streptomyces sp. NRRL F-5630 TaxID=1463864 RepID=UPI0004C90BEC|nr:TetR/AcrR family transcriptional regulator [Streptomyces sp. NRRL F-5630]